MPTFRKKPVEIQAVVIADLIRAARSDWPALPDWVRDAYEGGTILVLRDSIEIVTLEGRMLGGRDDWLIRGVQGELYPCKPDIFEATYEPVDRGPVVPDELYQD
ncbi:hypothetical protein ACLQ25_09580 [Micromonospora sp. DT44]|uniref:hypothetical protein n=1 Tax=Micromonospora sp. DT44 TaxID=3393439 RepID=UPI003CF44994